jgi:hypothetical protein
MAFALSVLDDISPPRCGARAPKKSGAIVVNGVHERNSGTPGAPQIVSHLTTYHLNQWVRMLRFAGLAGSASRIIDEETPRKE